MLAVEQLPHGRGGEQRDKESSPNASTSWQSADKTAVTLLISHKKRVDLRASRITALEACSVHREKL